LTTTPPNDLHAARAAEQPRWRAPPPLCAVRAAFVFFTRIPVGGFPYRPADWRWAAAHAPLVGLVLGGALGCLDVLLLPLGALSAAALVWAVALLLTGAFHEDGLADTSDALGGGYDVGKVLAILKDSRIGSFGGAALVVSIVGRTTLLAELGASSAWALPLAWCGARLGPVWLMSTMPYVTTDDASKSRQLTQGGLAQALVASAWFALAQTVAVGFGWLSVVRASALAAALLLVTLSTAYRYWVRVRGITGDFMGATEQIGELVALAVLVWRA
jgi:adenosylcobinamide-GDP ribazoletransferase